MLVRSAFLRQTERMPEIFAHRGLHSVERENTLEAFEAARKLGVDGVELDVRRTRDGELVVHHDPAIGEDVIAHSTRADLANYVPTLQESLDVLKGLKVNVEVKNIRDPREPTYDESGEFARDVLDALEHGPWLASGIISCFDVTTCARLRSFDQNVRVGWLLWADDVSEALTKAHVLGFQAVHPYFARVEPGHVGLARELGIELNVWTVNEVADMKRMASLGVDSIITDDPATALSLRA